MPEKIQLNKLGNQYSKNKGLDNLYCNIKAVKNHINKANVFILF
jgi:hypothetical protein